VVEVPELLTEDGVSRPAAGAADWIGEGRIVKEKRLDGVAGRSEAAGNRHGRCAAGPDECVDLAQVEAGEAGSGQVQAVEEPGRRLPGGRLVLPL
jgi:hypothetical protein